MNPADLDFVQDVGAMRFPDTPFMKRVFHLVRGDPKRDIKPKVDVKLIKYTLEDENTFLCYNSYHYKRSECFGRDPFHTNGLISDSDFKLNPEAVKTRIGDILQRFRAPFAEPNAQIGKLIESLIDKIDKYTMRSFLLSKDIPSPAITYYETLQYSSGWYDRALTETILEGLAFDWPKKKENKDPAEGSLGTGSGPFSSTKGAESEAVKWYCFE
jgi:hypothetical protein